MYEAEWLNNTELYLRLRSVVSYTFACFADIFHSYIDSMDNIHLRIIELDDGRNDPYTCYISVHHAMFL